MKLIYLITLRISGALLVLLTIWAVAFYLIIVDEINDETDDSLENYSEYIINQFLVGEELPLANNGTNNNYHIIEVTPEYAQQTEDIRYYYEDVYIEALRETEPARILKTIFRNDDGKYFELTVAIATFEQDDLRSAFLYWTGLLYLLLLVTIVLINVWVVHRSFKPLYKLIKWLDKYNIKKEHEPLVNETKVTEFKKLNTTISNTIERNQRIYDEQNLFIGNASHELQTPLAICRNRMETLINDPDLTENQAEQISKTMGTIDHMVKLNKTLLLLTKIENNQFPEIKSIDVNVFIQKQLEDLSDIYDYKSISVEIKTEGRFKLMMNETLSSILIGNLLKNAYVHNKNNGYIKIIIQDENLTISNSAIAGELNKDSIFKRFYQGAKKEGSTGLGLVLIKSICNLYKVNISYKFEELEDMHSFTLTSH